MRPAKCGLTGFPPFDTAISALKAGTRIVRHPLDTYVLVDLCSTGRHYHYRLVDRKHDVP